MADVARQHVGGRRALAQVVHQAGIAHAQRRRKARGLLQHHHHVHAGIDFGVVLGALGHAPQPCEFGQQCLERAAVAQHFEHALGRGLHQAARDFLPDAFGDQIAGFAGIDHLLHQGHGFGRDLEVVKTRRKTRHAQHAHRVFAKGVGHMAQQPGLQIALAAIGVVQAAAVRPAFARRHGIDRQVAPRQVFFQRHIGRGLDGKTAVAAAALALGAGQRIFLVAGRVQKHRKVAAHGLIALGHHLLGRRAHHHPVAVIHRPAQQLVAHRAADHQDLD
ncbi:hypothetical protein D3C78_1152370 [compost metagenome]